MPSPKPIKMHFRFCTTLYAPRAFCATANVWAGQLVSDWAKVTCLKCRGLVAAKGKQAP